MQNPLILTPIERPTRGVSTSFNSMAWLQPYAWLISILLSFFTLLVWVFYAYLLHRDAKQQRLPALFIQQANGYNSTSLCLLSNLGREIVHVLGVIAVLRTSAGAYYKSLDSRDRIDISQTEHARVQDIIKQGPLPSGYFLSMATFGEIVEPQEEDVLPNRRSHPAPAEVHEVEIRVAAVHAAYTEPIGAVRRFKLEWDSGEMHVYPESPLTKVLISRSERRQVERWVEQWIFRRPDVDE